ncbi:hypothetical protein B0H21DRAFT_740140 [Amylocystis lapponica]|nr:hypothetical protein B0H21DRAFT_740140 [Amylocystis lapponica]
MSLSTSPRKVVPLASGDDWPPRLRTKSTGSSITKRNTENGVEIPPDVQDLIASLGEPLDLGSESDSLPYVSKPFTNTSSTGTRLRAMTNSSALGDIVRELLVTERSYVNRLRMLKNDYADPLRTFARSKDTSILPLYEAKTLFGNIDNLLPVNEAFLADLEKMETPRGPGVGDVALKHFKMLKGFEHYRQYYSKREEAQAIFEREIKKSSGFAAFVDRIKYSSADTKNRVGLRELLMEPVQRIPRYTLMFRTMIKHMDMGDSQRAALLEADKIASHIALAETDEQTKRAATMYCLSASIDDFPPALVSHARRFIDCIDVEDVHSSIDGPFLPTASTAPMPNLHCTLFLFDDKLMIVKRPGNGERSGRALAGLDELERLAKAGGLPLGKKRSGMSCKGVVDVTDVVATDVGGADIHLYLEDPPQDQTDRWAGRPFRALSVVHPPSPVNLDPTRTEADKKRFLENLWSVQARYRTRAGQSVVLCADEREVENKGGKITMAKTYFNVYQRTTFLQEAKKTKIVLHIDSCGSADRLPFGMRGPPFVVVRVQPMAGELSRYKVTSSDPTDDGEDDIIQTGRVPDRIVQTIHQFGLFKFRTGKNSVPTTPTASLRSRAAIFGLDAISRNLFNARPGSAMGDLFGGSTNSHRRSRTTTSRASTYTQSTSTGDDSLTRFSRSNSSTTATSVSLTDDQSSSGSRRARSLSRAKKLIKRAKSPGGSGSEAEASPRRERIRSAQSPLRATSAEPESEWEDSDRYDEDQTMMHHTGPIDESERDLTMRLELARRNSQNQHEVHYSQATEPMEATIYEEDPPNLSRPLSRASRELPDLPRDTQSQRSTTPRPLSTTPTRAVSLDPSPRRHRSTSRHSADRRPLGPRTPSPLPPRSPRLFAVDDERSVDADDSELDTRVDMMQTQTPTTPTRPLLPRSKRQPFEPTENTDTPRAASVEPPKRPGSVEPLSIRKKTFMRTNSSGSPSLQRKLSSAPRSVPGTKVPSRVSSPRKTSGQSRASRVLSSGHTAQYPMLVDMEDTEQLLRRAETTKADLESSHRAVKRIKLETAKLRCVTPESSSAGDIDRPASPVKGSRIPQQGPPVVTREAQARMEEMRQLIGKRYGESTPRSRHQSMVESPSLSRLSSPVHVEDIYQSIDDLATQADREILRAIKSQNAAHSDIVSLTAKLKEKSSDLDSARTELRSTKRQCELVKSLLADCTAEKEFMYEAFNEELDGMFNDVHLPENDAWANMTKDLRKTKDDRNALSNENSNLKRRLAEMELQNEEWVAVLRAHGLIHD